MYIYLRRKGEFGDRKQVGPVASLCLPQSQREYMINRSQSSRRRWGVNRKGDTL